MQYLTSRKQLLLMAVMLLSILCKGQHSKSDMVGFLTNEKSRTWILGNYQVSMGSCGADGQSFTFFKDGLLNWKVCENGKARTTEIHWSLTYIEGTFSGYEITFSPPIQLREGESLATMHIDFDSPKKNASNKKMIWRMPSVKEKQEPRATLISKN